MRFYALLFVLLSGLLYWVNLPVLISELKLKFHPEWFHGHGKSSHFFEGWYFKMVTEDDQHSFVVIAGIFFGNSSDALQNHAFVMTIRDGHTSSKYNFGTNLFVSSNNSFSVQIGENYFSDEGITLDLAPKPGDNATSTIKGQVKFKDLVRWPITLTAPGVMGWYSYVPTLECFHGVVSMHHKISGNFTIDRNIVSFDEGKGYIEKDWGTNFPSTWIWFQTNHFPSNPETSIFLSIASVPWKGYSFPGFLVGFWHNSTLHILTTWSGANFTIPFFQGTEARFVVSDTDFQLDISLHDTSEGVLLYGPRFGEMVPFVRESVTCLAEVKFSKKENGKVLFHDVGKIAGCEFVGNIDWMLKNL